jgi:hypothetical protein
LVELPQLPHVLLLLLALLLRCYADQPQRQQQQLQQHSAMVVPSLPQMQHGPFLAHAEMVSAAAVAGVVLETTTITTPEEEVMKGRQLSACLRF